MHILGDNQEDMENAMIGGSDEDACNPSSLSYATTCVVGSNNEEDEKAPFFLGDKKGDEDAKKGLMGVSTGEEEQSARTTEHLLVLVSELSEKLEDLELQLKSKAEREELYQLVENEAIKDSNESTIERFRGKQNEGLPIMPTRSNSRNSIHRLLKSDTLDVPSTSGQKEGRVSTHRAGYEKVEHDDDTKSEASYSFQNFFRPKHDEKDEHEDDTKSEASYSFQNLLRRKYDEEDDGDDSETSCSFHPSMPDLVSFSFGSSFATCSVASEETSAFFLDSISSLECSLKSGVDGKMSPSSVVDESWTESSAQISLCSKHQETHALNILEIRTFDARSSVVDERWTEPAAQISPGSKHQETRWNSPYLYNDSIPSYKRRQRTTPAA